jgi:hypothetical protein
MASLTCLFAEKGPVSAALYVRACFRQVRNSQLGLNPTSEANTWLSDHVTVWSIPVCVNWRPQRDDNHIGPFNRSTLWSLVVTLCTVYVGVYTLYGVCIFRSRSLFYLPVHSRCRGFYFCFHLITLKHTPHSVGLLWTRDRPVAETSTWQHKHCTREKNSCPRWDSNPRSQQALGRRPTP